MRLHSRIGEYLLRKGIGRRVSDTHVDADTPAAGTDGYDRGSKPDLAPSAAKEAIVYLPSIAPSKPERDIASLLCRTLDGNSNYRFKCEEANHVISYKDGEREWYSKKFTISKIERKEIDEKVYDDPYPIADVYWLDYQETARGCWYWQTDFIKSFQLTINGIGFLLVGLVFAFCGLFRRSGKHSGHLLQLIFLTFLTFVLVVGYFVLMVWAFAASIIALTPSTLKDLSITKAFAIVTFAADFVLPGCLRDGLNDAIMLFNSLMIYFTPCGDRKRRALKSQIRKFLERIQGLDDGKDGTNYPYERIHLVGMSFGSCLAIDALFSKDVQPDTRVFGRVSHLVTLGCPFDLIRTLQPTYYTSSRYRGRNNICWTNIFIPEDFLSSNFRNDYADENDPDARFAVDGAFHPDPHSPNRYGLPQPNKAFSNWSKPECCCFLFVQGIIAHMRYFEHATDPNMICSRILEAIFANPSNDEHWVARGWSPTTKDKAADGGGGELASAEEGRCSAGSTHSRALSDDS